MTSSVREIDAECTTHHPGGRVEEGSTILTARLQKSFANVCQIVIAPLNGSLSRFSPRALSTIQPRVARLIGKGGGSNQKCAAPFGPFGFWFLPPFRDQSFTVKNGVPAVRLHSGTSPIDKVVPRIARVDRQNPLSPNPEAELFSGISARMA